MQPPLSRALSLLCLLLLLCAPRTHAQYWSTFAGPAGGAGFTDAQGTSARFGYPTGVAIDPVSGDLFVADRTNDSIRRVKSDGTVSTFVSASAGMDAPRGLAFDSSGNLFVVASQSHAIFKITPSGTVSVFAGAKGAVGSSDGNGTNARFNFPHDLAFDKNGNLFVADWANHAIRKISPAGDVTTLAGSAGQGGSANGTGTLAQFNGPTGLVADSTGNIFVADTKNHCIRKITPTGTVTTFAGLATESQPFAQDGLAGGARFNSPRHLAIDSGGNLYVSDKGNNLVRKITPQGSVSTVAGVARTQGSKDGPAATAQFGDLEGIAVNPAGAIFVTDTDNQNIRQISPGGVVSVFAGSPPLLDYVDGNSQAARFKMPKNLTVDGVGNLYVADQDGKAVRKVTQNGAVSTLATGFYSLSGITLDTGGNLFACDFWQHKVIKINPDGTLSTIAGATPVGSTDGPVSTATFNRLSATAVDTAGNIFVAEFDNKTIRKITPTGTVSTLAGLAGASGSTDGTGSAARFSLLSAMTIDSKGNLYCVDSGNSRIRKITPAGVVTTVNPTTTIDLSSNHGHGICVAPSGDLYITTPAGHGIAKVTQAGVVTYVVARQSPGSANGNSTTAKFNSPTGIAIDANGNLFVADTGNSKIRMGILKDIPITITAQPQSATLTEGGPVSFSVQVTGTEPITYQWRKNSTNISGATSPNLSISTTKPTDSGAYDCVITNGAGSVTSTAATLRVNAVVPVPVTITANPVNTAAYPGVPIALRVEATGTAPIAYQWRKNGSALSGGSSQSYAIPSPQASDAGTYEVVVTNSQGSKTSASATVTLGTFTAGQGYWRILGGNTGGAGAVDGVGAAARFSGTSGITIDSQGNLYLASRTAVRKITADGAVTTLAGSMGSSGTQDGTGPNARFNNLNAIAFDSANTLLVAGNGSVRKVTLSGVTTTLTTPGGTGIAPDGSGGAYVARSRADQYGTSIYRINASGQSTLLAGSTVEGGTADGTGPAATFTNVMQMTTDPQGNLYAADTDNGLIRKITPGGVVSTLAVPRFTRPYGIARDAQGNLYVSSLTTNRIFKISPSLSVGTLAGREIGSADGSGTSAQFYGPSHLCVDAAGNVFVADRGNNLVRKITPSGVVTTVAGKSERGFVDGAPATARMRLIAPTSAITVDASKNVYFLDSNAVRKMAPDGSLTTIAGSIATGKADGPGATASFFIGGGSITRDTAGNLYVSDSGNHSIRKIGLDGTVRTIAGGNGAGFLDGPAASARFSNPRGLVFDKQGNLLIADIANHRIRKLSADGSTVSTLAGSGIEGGQDGSASTAQFSSPNALAMDSKGNLHVGNTPSDGNSTIRKITPDGNVTTVGNANGDLVPIYGMAFDSKDTLYFTGADCLRTLSTDSSYRVVAGGGGTTEFSTGTTAQINLGNPGGLAIDADDNFYVADTGNSNIRLGVTKDVPLQITAHPQTASVSVGGAATFSVAVTGSAPAYQWRKGGANLPGATSQSLTLSPAQLTDAASYDVLIVNGLGAVVSNAAALTVNATVVQPILITSQPRSTAVNEGYPVSLSVTATGAPPLAYQWRKNSLPITGANSPNFNLSPTKPTDTANYDVVITNPAGNLTSDTATLTVIPPPPTPAAITQQPASVASYPGVNATFRVTATGNPAPSYQWRKDGTDIPGATGASYTLPSVGSLSAGTYDVVVTNPLATLTSAPARLTLKAFTSGVGNWSTLAGSPGGAGYADGIGTAARVSGPGALVRDGAGNIYIADRFNHVIRKMSPAGVLSTYAGVPLSSGSIDGTAAAAKFNQPTGLALDSSGNLYVADTQNFKIRKISPSGQVSTLAGSGGQGNADGAGTTAMFDLPERIVVDAAGNLYVSQNEVIRKISPTGTVSTLAGVYGSRGSANGTGPAAQFRGISDLTLDASGNVIVFDRDNSLIRRVTPAGVVTTLLGTGTPGYLDGPKATAKLQQPHAGTFDASGHLYFIDASGGRIRKLGTDGNVSTVAGNGTLGETDGPIATATLRYPTAIVMESGGTFLLSDGDLLRRVTPTGTVSTLVGVSVTGNQDGTGSAARFGMPFAIAMSASGDAYVSDSVNGNVNSVRKITREGRVTTLASGFIKIRGLAVDKNANVYVTVDGLVVKKIQPNGTVTTFAGSGTSGFADGPAATASFGRATGLASDGAGNLFVADPGNYAIRKIDPNGMVSTLAGGTAGPLDGTGRAAQFQGISGIAADAGGTVVVFETSSTTGNRIRKISPSGEVTTVATRFSSGYAMAVDPAGNLYTSSDYAHVLQKSPPTGTAIQFAGIRNLRGSTDGPANVATFNTPMGLAFNPDGNLLVVDSGNCRIRLGTFTDVQPVFSAQPSSQAATFGNAVTFTAAAAGSPPFSYQWRKGGVEIPGATGASYTRPSVQLADADTYDVIIANGAGAIASAAATLTVSPPQNSSLVITGQPQSNTLLVGQSASLRVTATGLAPIQFQWRKGGINIEGATFAAYNLPNAQLSDTGSYDVVVTNPGGSVISSSATLTVNPPPLAAPKITVQPASVASFTRVSATFAVTATGNPAPTYQWLKNGTNIPNATSASYTIASVGTLDAGSYSVVASNAQGSVTSSAAVLTTKTIVPEKGNWRVLAGAPGGRGYADGTGSAARFDEPTGLAFDAAGNLFVSNYLDLTIRKITPGGVVSTAAGKGYVRTFGALGPYGLAFDSKGTMYCAVVYGALYKFDSAGKPSAIPTPAMTSGYPKGLAIDSGGNFFISSGCAIWKVSASGAAAVFAGSPDTAGTNDGNGISARFSEPGHLALDDRGNIYVADTRVRIISPGGNVTTLPGAYENPNGVAVDPSGNVWITSGRVVQKITPAGVVTTIAGNKDKEGCTDGPGATALFSRLAGIALDKAGNIFVADQGANHTIRKITPAGVVSTFAGASPIGSADGQGTAARFYSPRRIAFDASGNILVADAYNNTIRKVTPAGAVTTVAGSAGFAGGTDGVGSAARFNHPVGVAVDPKGIVFVTEHYGRKLRKILQTGSVTTVTTGYLSGVDVDSDGTVFFSDQNLIRKISPNGASSVFAGNLAAGDAEGFGASASFNRLSGLRVSKNGDLFVADPGNTKIRRISSGGVVSTFSKGEYPAFWEPSEVALNEDGSLYALGYGNLLKVERDGSYSSIAKPNGTSFGGVAVDANGNLVLSDTAGSKIWAATLADVPLKITSQPAATVADRGTAATFSVGATGSGPISYQWRRNGVEIPGATLATLGRAQAQASDAGSYDVVLSNGAGAVVSAAAELAVTIPPDVPVAITTQPVGGSVYLGSYVSLSVQTTGTQPIAYQWRKGGFDIPGATGSTYSIASANASHSGNYEVTASNVLGTVTSAQATLSVSPFTTNPIVITAQPLGALVVLGGPATFAVTGSLKAGAGATEPLTYQWRKNGVAIEGAVSPTYTLDSAQLSDSGSYDVLLTCGLANAVSLAATLTVGLPVSITTGPAATTVKAGASFELSVTPGGTGPFSYQWSKNGVNIPKGTSSRLSISAATLADAGLYEVGIRNPFGAYPDSPSAQVIVQAPPVLTKDPLSLQLKVGSSGTLSVTATGTAPLGYQWRRNGVALPGATLAAYTIPAATEESAGAYDVIVSNALGTAVSSRSTVLVNVPTQIVRQPAGASVHEGSVLSLNVLAKGTGTLRYQWYKWEKSGKLTNPGNQATLPLGAAGTVTAADAGTYMVTVSGYGPMVTSEQVVVEVHSGRGIAILEQPSDLKLLKGAALTAFVRIDATGGDVLETRYTLCSVTEKGAVPTPIGGSVPASGALAVPLRGFADSRAVVQFTRTYSDGTTATAQTQPFALTQYSWEEGAGTYEAVLLDMNSPVTLGDGGLARGFLTLNVSRTGAVSGRLMYVEAGSISGAPAARQRAYQPVARSFTGSFTPSQSASTVVVLRPRLGVGSQAGRQELALELDIAADPPTLKATVKDNVSLPAPAFILSRAENCTRTTTPLPASTATLVGRYVLAANEAAPAGSNAADNNAYLLAQVLGSGRVLWSTRLTGYAGAGSSGVNTTNPLQIVAPIFESRATAGGTQSSAVALFGRLVWEPTLSQTWSASVSAGTLTNRLEKQVSRISGTRAGSGFTPVYEQARFDDRSNGSSVQLLDFSDQIESNWGATPLSTVFPAARGLTLRVRDPLTQPATDLTWNVTVSESGVVRATGLTNNGLTAPPLSLRLDRTRGEWLGSYISGGVRRTLVGAALEPSAERGRGWVEIGPNSGRWRLELAQ